MGISPICFKAFNQLTQFLQYISDMKEKTQNDSRGNYYRLRLRNSIIWGTFCLDSDLNKYSNQRHLIKYNKVDIDSQ